MELGDFRAALAFSPRPWCSSDFPVAIAGRVGHSQVRGSNRDSRAFGAIVFDWLPWLLCDMEFRSNKFDGDGFGNLAETISGNAGISFFMSSLRSLR